MNVRIWTLGELWKTSLDKEYDIQCFPSKSHAATLGEWRLWPFKIVGRCLGVNLIHFKGCVLRKCGHIRGVAAGESGRI